MKSVRLAIIAGTFLASMVFATAGNAFFLNFENGTDGGYVSDIGGVSFSDFNGYFPKYGDSRANAYNTSSDDLNYSYGTGAYHHNGNFFVWAGPNADAQGLKVDFTSNDGTWFQVGYSAYSNFYVEAYLTDGSMVSAMGDSNVNGPMDLLRVDATSGLFIDYIVLHDSGNYWCIDDMSGDATGVSPVPEPGTILLLGAGLLGLGFYGRKRMKA